jgi:signal transduction histidine kinase
MTPETARKGSMRDAAIGILLFAALLVLAVKQYQWIGLVSEADRARLQRELQNNLDHLGNDFDTEVERLIRAILLSGPDEKGKTDEEVIATRVQMWRNLAIHPPLLAGVWLPESPNLPMALVPLARRLQPLAGPNRGGGRGNRYPFLVDGTSGAFAIGRSNWNGPFDPEQQRWLIIQLDMDYVKKEWLPELVGKNFNSDFHVRIYRPADNQTLYETERTSDGRVADEVSENLFGFRGGGGGFGKGRGGPPGPPPDSKGPPDKLKPGPKQFDRSRGEPDFNWRAVASRQSGTTAELVAEMRMRNLAVSFGILLLMGVSVGMLIHSTRRSNALALQQMEFVAGVTHELRTPLAVILSASQNLADGVTGGEARVRRYGGVIHAQTKRLAGMVEQVLRFAGLSSQHAELLRGPVEVPALIHEAVTDCRPELDAAGAKLTVLVDETLPPIDGDRAALLHGLRNLLENAAKHGRGAAIRLRASADPQGRIEIVVEDDGPGVDPGDLPYLFEPFYRGQRAKEDQVHGSGLGLSLVKKIVEAHQGTITADSRPGHGASFRMVLPAAKVAKTGEE